MKYELKCVDDSILNADDRSDIDKQIESIIARHKGNRYQVNCLVFESVAALTASENLVQKKASQGFLKRFWNNLTGKNNRLQADIDRNLARAQYASQQTLQKLAEQNLMSFELITAVNNKLNASMLAVEQEINNVYGTMRDICDTMQNFFRQSRADIMQLATRVERLERNVDLLNWQNSIEYQMYDGVEYCELDDVTKMVCLTHDFFNITEGNWRTSDLLLLKSAMGTIGLDVHGKMSYEKFIRQVGTNRKLYQHLIGEDVNVRKFASNNELLSVSIDKMDRLGNDEQYIISATENILQENGIELPSESIAYQMVNRYVAQEENIHLETKVSNYELALELLYNMEQLKYTKELNKKFRHAKTLFLNCMIQEAIPLLEELGESGNTQARYILALIYNERINVDCNSEYVRELLEANLLEKDVYSLRMYQKYGLPVDAEFEEFCNEKLSKLAENGDAFAQFELEKKWLYHNDEMALKYCRLGVESVFFLSYFSMAHYYYEDARCVVRDYNTAKKYLNLAANMGYGRAMARIGDYYVNNYEGITQDIGRGVEWYKRAYETGYSTDGTINQIARHYSNEGNGNNEEALKWWHIGEEKGYFACIANLGWSYRWGKGVSVDYQRAIEYFRRSSELGGNGDAERNLGDMYLNGNGVASNRTEARLWYEKGAEKGNEYAKKWLNDNPA